MDASLVSTAAIFVLALARVAGLLAAGPFFAGHGTPAMFKAGAAFFLTLMVLPQLTGAHVAVPPSLLGLALAVGREVAVGASAGLMAQLVFSAVQMAGELLGMQMGLSMMNLVDPNSGAPLPVIAQFYGLFATLLFFVLDAHHVFVRGIFLSFDLAPLGAPGFGTAVAVPLTALVGKLFVMSVELAAPVMAALFLTDVALGLVARTIPQMNIFTVGYPLKIALGLVTLAVTLPLLATLITRQFAGLEGSLQQVLRGM